MKKMISACLLFLTACTTTPGNIPSPAKVATQVCPPLTTALMAVSALSPLAPTIEADVAVASTTVHLVCDAGSSIQVTNLQTLANTALPNLISAIKASNLPLDQQNAIILDLTAANIILNGVLNSLQ